MNSTEMEWFTEEELKSLFKKEEGNFIERCESPIVVDKISKAVCAFSNDLSNKGKSVIFIGVKDNGECTGLSVTDEVLRNIASIRSDGNILPLPVIKVQKIHIKTNEIVALQVQAAGFPPVKYKSRCLVRVGPSVRIASVDEERLLTEKRQTSDLPFDMQGVPSSNIESDINMDFFKDYYLPAAVSREVLQENNRDIKIQMRSLRLMDHQFDPTKACLLVMGKDPRNWFPGAYIQFIRFDGEKLTDPIKNQKEVSGVLQDQIVRIEDILRYNIATTLSLSDNGMRVESSDYPFLSLSQLIRNAVMHRNYESHTPVKVYWFTDRIEIQSPGGPYGELNKDNFGSEGLTSYRNPIIAEALKILNYVEKFGFGIPQAKKALKENGNPDLEFQIKESTVLAIVKRKL